MGLKKFLVSKKGALTATGLAAGAGIGANVAIAETQKATLAETAMNAEYAKIQIAEKMDYLSLDSFKEFIHILANTPGEYGHEYAVQILGKVDAVGKAAELTAHWQPKTLIGTAAAFCIVGIVCLTARHFAKKSLDSEMTK